MKSTSNYMLLLSVLLPYILISCDETSELPTLSTDPITSISDSRGVSGGSIISIGNEVILQKGVCWSTNPQPTVNNDTTNEGSGNDPFISIIWPLKENTDYYVRSYAKTKTGVGYGPQLGFTTGSGSCGEQDSIYYSCDEAYILSYPGTACCVSGFAKVAPGDILTYEYISNFPNTEVTWYTSSSSITLLSGQNTSIASFKFGDDFSSGSIVGSGNNNTYIDGVRTGKSCSEVFCISSQ